MRSAAKHNHAVHWPHNGVPRIISRYENAAAAAAAEVTAEVTVEVAGDGARVCTLVA